MNDYGIDKYIRKDEFFPETKLAKRLAPLSKKVDQTTREFRTYRIPIGILRRRVKIPEKDCLFGLKVPETLSYLAYDLPFSWKDPKYWKSLHRGGEYDEYATVIDEAGYVDPDQDLNEVFIYSTFNMLSKKDFFDTETGSWKIKNSYELEKAIDCTCTLVDIKAVLFDKKKLFNIEEKRKTVKGTEKGLVPHRNIANTGIRFDEEEGKLVGGENEYLPFNCLIEWYVPYFDNETDKHELFKVVPIDNGDYIFEDNKTWLEAYLKCLPKDYRPEKRITLLYRRYDERRENELVKEYALKSNFVNILINKLFIDNNLNFKEVVSEIEKTLTLIKFLLNLKTSEKKYINLKEYLDLIKNVSESIKSYTENEKKLEFLQEDVKNRFTIFKTKLLQTTGILIEPDLRKGYKPLLEKFQKYKGYKSFENSFYNLDEKNLEDNKKTVIGNLLGVNYTENIVKVTDFMNIMQKELYIEFSEKLHHMRRKICGRVIKAGKYDEVVWTFMSFKEPAKG